MFDINFYMKLDNIMKDICVNNITDKTEIFNKFESIRSKQPVIYNIETTNMCNMSCKMCPRTNLMTRKIENISELSFYNIANQIKPHSDELWEKWVSYCTKKYGISPDSKPSENHFFLYIISNVIQLHGFGEPVLDKNISKYIKILNEKNIKTYLSTNPININFNQTLEMMKSGLSYLKYCFDGIDDNGNRIIRGNTSDFNESYKKVCQVLKMKKQYGLSTVIVITMINLNKENQEEEFIRLNELFANQDVYLYLKSENSQWYRKNFHGTKAIHGSEICKHPWMSMTIKSNGEVAMCMDDYNNEIILGDAKIESLEEIWNGKRYDDFRRSHINSSNEKCDCRCDLITIGEKIKKG